MIKTVQLHGTVTVKVFGQDGAPVISNRITGDDDAIKADIKATLTAWVDQSLLVPGDSVHISPVVY